MVYFARRWSICAPTPPLARARRCARRWPRPTSETSSASRICRSTRCASRSRSSSATRRRCSCPPGRCATPSPSASTSIGRAARRSCIAPRTPCSTRVASPPRPPPAWCTRSTVSTARSPATTCGPRPMTPRTATRPGRGWSASSRRRTSPAAASGRWSASTTCSPPRASAGCAHTWTARGSCTPWSRRARRRRRRRDRPRARRGRARRGLTQSSNSTCSRPTTGDSVSPPTLRTATSTPGMKDVRSIES